MPPKRKPTSRYNVISARISDEEKAIIDRILAQGMAQNVNEIVRTAIANLMYVRPI